jgi:hypothetical protein
MLAPYLLTSTTASMLTPYVLKSVTSSMTVLSSSFAATASFVNRLTQNVIVTGSLFVSNSIDSNNKYLIANNGIASVHWNNYRLYNSDNNLVVHWGTGDLYSGSFTSSSISWTNRLLRNSVGTTKVDWENNYLYDTAGNTSIDWSNRNLLTSGSVLGLDWSNDTVSRARVYQRQELTTVKAESLSSTAYTYAGQAIDFTGYIHGSCVLGNLVYLGSDGIWRAVDAASGNSAYLLGIYLGSNSVLLEGDVVIDETQNIDSPAPGRPVYFLEGNATGKMSTTIPTSGIVRVVGHCYWNNVNTQTKNWILKFRPSNDWYEI